LTIVRPTLEVIIAADNSLSLVDVKDAMTPRDVITRDGNEKNKHCIQSLREFPVEQDGMDIDIDIIPEVLRECLGLDCCKSVPIRGHNRKTFLVQLKY
jgi:hypothetical protein